MRRPLFTTEDILFAYTQTPATMKQIAAKHHVGVATIRSLLIANLTPSEFERLKFKKHQHNRLRENLIRYRAQYGL
jgi:hypothetical protein